MLSRSAVSLFSSTPYGATCCRLQHLRHAVHVKRLRPSTQPGKKSRKCSTASSQRREPGAAEHEAAGDNQQLSEPDSAERTPKDHHDPVGGHHDGAHGAAHQLQHRAAEKMTFQLLEKVAERMSERVGERVSERLTERVGERVAERAGERLLERAGERALERAGERAIERAGERAVEQATERAAERAAEKVAGRAAERVAQRAAERAAERTGERIAERAAGRAAERATERAFEVATERAGERASQRVVQLAAERAAERATEHAATRAMERAGEHAAERVAERVAVHASDNIITHAGEAAAAAAAGHVGSRRGLAAVLDSILDKLLGSRLMRRTASPVVMARVGRGALVGLPAIGALFVAHLAHQDWHRLAQEHAAGNMASAAAFAVAFLGDVLDVAAHVVVVAGLLHTHFQVGLHVDHHLLHCVEAGGLAVAAVGTVAATLGEVLAVRATWKVQRDQRKAELDAAATAAAAALDELTGETARSQQQQQQGGLIGAALRDIGHHDKAVQPHPQNDSAHSSMEIGGDAAGWRWDTVSDNIKGDGASQCTNPTLGGGMCEGEQHQQQQSERAVRQDSLDGR